MPQPQRRRNSQRSNNNQDEATQAATNTTTPPDATAQAGTTTTAAEVAAVHAGVTPGATDAAFGANRILVETENMDATNAVDFMHEGLDFITEKLQELTDKATYHAAVTAETDSLGSDFAPFAHTKLATAYKNDYSQAPAALADSIKAYNRSLQGSSNQRRGSFDRDHDHA